MEEQITFIYCISDDFLKSFGLIDNNQVKMNNAEVMTIALVSALFFGGNISRARLMLLSHKYIKNILSESRLNRRMHDIDLSVWQAVFEAISQTFQSSNKNLEYLVDSMPVEACMNIRSYRCKLLKGKEFIGFCKAKKKFYYGFKIHMIVTSAGLPVEFIITPASTADITAFKMMEIDLPFGSSVYGDKAYTSYPFEDELMEHANIRLVADRKKNLTRQHPGPLRYIQRVLRKRIETTFSQLTLLFPRKIHAVTTNGLILKLVIFIVAYSLKKYTQAALVTA
jgi:IS5 family transposase